MKILNIKLSDEKYDFDYTEEETIEDKQIVDSKVMSYDTSFSITRVVEAKHYQIDITGMDSEEMEAVYDEIDGLFDTEIRCYITKT